MNKRQQAEEIKTKCGKVAIGRGKCYVCGCKVSRRGMTIHHLWYIFDDVVHKNYHPRNDTNTLRYYTDLEHMVKKEPKRFMYLCNPCHTSLEKLNQFGDPKLKKLMKARKLTKTRRK